MPRYNFDIRSITLSHNYRTYLENQFSFIQALNFINKNNLLIRLYKDDYGWGVESEWKSKFPELNYDLGSKDSITKMISKCRLIVCTYCGTSYTECLAANIPTIIFGIEM